MTTRENMLRAVRFERPEAIPMRFVMNASCWHHYPQEALVELMLDHPYLFPGYQPPELPYTPAYNQICRADEPYTDSWGCRWETADDGISGAVVRHPLADWSAFDDYTPPDPARTTGCFPIDPDQEARNFAARKERGELLSGGLEHGHTFLRLTYIRGYENLLYDMTDDHPNLHRLIDMVEQFNAAVVRRHLDLGAEWMSYPEDLGMQVGPMLSPSQFRRYIKPVYQRLMAPAREAGCIVHMHSDGDIRQLVDDLIDGGVEVINLQDLVNGIDWIADKFAGKTAIDLDVDRQEITRFGTPAQIDALIREEVTRLGSREGGLLMVFGLYPGAPLANVRALMDAMERYASYYN